MESEIVLRDVNTKDRRPDAQTQSIGLEIFAYLEIIKRQMDEEIISKGRKEKAILKIS